MLRCRRLAVVFVFFVLSLQARAGEPDAWTSSDITSLQERACEPALGQVHVSFCCRRFAFIIMIITPVRGFLARIMNVSKIVAGGS